MKQIYEIKPCLRSAGQVLPFRSVPTSRGFNPKEHTGHWNGVREAHLSRLINEYHVAGLSPCVRVVDDVSSRVDTTRSLLLEKPS